MNIVSAIFQIGLVVFMLAAAIAFQGAEAQAKEDRRARLPKIDLSDCPPFLPAREPKEEGDE